MVLHVDADEVAAGGRPLDQASEVLAAEFAIDLEPQEGQLDGDVAVETLVADRLHEVDVKPGPLDCEFPAVDLLAEERQGPSQSLRFRPPAQASASSGSSPAT